jgi:hypothetical protein
VRRGGRIRLVVGALLVSAVAAGCGGTDGHGTASSERSAATPKQVPIAGAPAVAATAPDPAHATAIVNTVCAAVRHGAPPPLAAPYTRARVVRYVNGARPPLRRVEVSLRRIARQQPQPRGLDRLVTAVRDLRAAYAAAPGLLRAEAGARRAADAIAQNEALVSAVARQADVPACAVG